MINKNIYYVAYILQDDPFKMCAEGVCLTDRYLGDATFEEKTTLAKYILHIIMGILCRDKPFDPILLVGIAHEVTDDIIGGEIYDYDGFKNRVLDYGSLRACGITERITY